MKMKYNFHTLFVLDDFTIILNCAGVSKLLTGSMYFRIRSFWIILHLKFYSGVIVHQESGPLSLLRLCATVFSSDCH